MNLWLKDGAKKLGMIWTWKPEAEKDALLHLQAAALHLWLQHELYQYNCNNFSTKSVQRLGHMTTVTDTSFGHAVCLSSLLSISRVLFLLLWATQSKNHMMCVLGMCRMYVIHTSSPTDSQAWTTSVTSSAHNRVRMLLWILLCKWSKMKTIKARTKPEARAFSFPLAKQKMSRLIFRILVHEHRCQNSLLPLSKTSFHVF